MFVVWTTRMQVEICSVRSLLLKGWTIGKVMGAGDWGMKQRQFFLKNRVFPRKLLINNMNIYIPADSCQKKYMPKEEKKKDFHLTCTRSVTLVVPWQICQNWYHIRINILWLLLRFQIPRLRSEHFRFVAQTCRGQSVSFCIICTTSWAVLHLSMLIVRLVLTSDAV